MKYIVFATQQYEYMKSRILSADPDAGDGSIERKSFPDGERYQRIATDVAGLDIMIVGGTITDSDTLEIYDMACAIAKYGAKRLSIVIPYYGYSTMERSTKPGEVVTAKTRARLLSSIPSCPEGNRVFLLDIHSEGIPHYFEGNIRPIHVYAKDATKKLITDFGGKDYLLACTDAGRAKWVESLANDLGVPASFIFKQRLGDSEVKVSKVSATAAEVKDKPVVIYDDMLRTGSSMMAAILAYRYAGASKVYVVVTHGVMDKGFDKIKNSVDGIGVTDSHPTIGWGRSSTDTFKIHSIAGLLAEKVRNTP